MSFNKKKKEPYQKEALKLYEIFKDFPTNELNSTGLVNIISFFREVGLGENDVSHSGNYRSGFFYNEHKYGVNKCDDQETFLSCLKLENMKFLYLLTGEPYRSQMKNAVAQSIQNLTIKPMSESNKDLLIFGFFREISRNKNVQFEKNIPKVVDKYLFIEERQKTLKDYIYERVEKDFSMGIAIYVKNNIFDGDMDDESIRYDAKCDIDETELIQYKDIKNLEIRQKILLSIQDEIKNFDRTNHNLQTNDMRL